MLTENVVEKFYKWVNLIVNVMFELKGFTFSRVLGCVYRISSDLYI